MGDAQRVALSHFHFQSLEAEGSVFINIHKLETINAALSRIKKVYIEIMHLENRAKQEESTKIPS